MVNGRGNGLSFSHGLFSGVFEVNKGRFLTFWVIYDGFPCPTFKSFVGLNLAGNKLALDYPCNSVLKSGRCRLGVA